MACQTSSLPVEADHRPGAGRLADDDVGQDLAALRLGDQVDAALVVDLELGVLGLLLGDEIDTFSLPSPSNAALATGSSAA